MTLDNEIRLLMMKGHSLSEIISAAEIIKRKDTGVQSVMLTSNTKELLDDALERLTAFFIANPNEKDFILMRSNKKLTIDEFAHAIREFVEFNADKPFVLKNIEQKAVKFLTLYLKRYEKSRNINLKETGYIISRSVAEASRKKIADLFGGK